MLATYATVAAAALYPLLCGLVAVRCFSCRSRHTNNPTL